MRKCRILLISIVSLSLFILLMSSCKKSHETPVKPKLSFSEATKTVKESDGTIDITMTLDKPSPEAVSITYELSGTAVDKVTAGTNAAYDYEITSSYLETKIKKGETIGTISVKLYSDFNLEDNEDIQIAIKNTDSQNIEITRDDNIKITVTQEDGLIVLLEWPAPTVDSLADMDILLRAGQNTATWDGILSGSAKGSFTGPEPIFIPKVLDFPAYGLSYTYYDGTFHKLDFTATFVDFANGAVEPEAQQQVFNATYTAANKNKWTDANTTVVVQTFEKVSGAFTAPSAIAVPSSGSRIGSQGHLSSTIIKQSESAATSNLILPFLKRR